MVTTSTAPTSGYFVDSCLVHIARPCMIICGQSSECKDGQCPKPCMTGIMGLRSQTTPAVLDNTQFLINLNIFVYFNFEFRFTCFVKLLSFIILTMNLLWVNLLWLCNEF